MKTRVQIGVSKMGVGTKTTGTLSVAPKTTGTLSEAFRPKMCGGTLSETPKPPPKVEMGGRENEGTRSAEIEHGKKRHLTKMGTK